MDEIQIYKHDKLGELRVTGTAENPMFCLSDVCKSLELGNVTALKSRLDGKGFNQIKVLTNGGYQQIFFVNEPNLYRCIFRSDKEKAKEFQDWVFNDVLPSIRKTGGYMVAKQEDTPEIIMARALKVANETLDRQKRRMEQVERDNRRLTVDNEMKQGEIDKLTPDAEYTRKTLSSTTSWNTNIIAKEMGMAAVTLNKKLERIGVQYKQHGVWVLTRKYANKGYDKSQTYSYLKSDGEVGTRIQMEWTESGRRFLHELHNNGRI